MAGIIPVLASNSMLFFSLCIILKSSLAKSNSSFSLKLIPRDHPISPLYPGIHSQVERGMRLHQFSEARSSYLLSLATGNATRNLNEVGFDLQLKHLYYVVKLKIGLLDPFTLYLLADTAAKLTWTQCQTYYNNYKQKSNVYDSRGSETFRYLPKNDPTCSHPNSYFQITKGYCTYKIKYSNDILTSGIGSLERMEVSDEMVLENVIFGCSTSAPIKFLEDNKISGVIGLSDSPVSIISQFPEKIKGRYSYCFLPIQSARPSHLYITYGDNIRAMTGLHKTKFKRSLKRPELFYLNVVDISVGETRLRLSSETFKLRIDGTGGVLIDSGTLIPTLDGTIEGSAYSIVMSYFESFYRDFLASAKLDLKEKTGYDLCYKYDRNFHDYPSLTYHLEEDLDYAVDKEFTIIINEEENYFCVAIAKGNGFSTLGAWHQQNMRLVFDINENELHYNHELCKD